ncbi:MAG TPA: hypothetical protein EYP28_00220, partial [Methanophagales archaeon]|nr:hypothetical protein [Methanophagales archaeon]
MSSRSAPLERNDGCAKRGEWPRLFPGLCVQTPPQPMPVEGGAHIALDLHQQVLFPDDAQHPFVVHDV